ncbi:hypothetical protein EXE42_03155 [Halorubrum sp. SP3]|uniref:hypothetical protein n=1 Tax=Halorubrum sp. SP3 TaxID=1537265 RepID=UPI0010F77269|nr:hypothetical protein [Halorubrum sp. SP3]TKX55481.1 hypothetical protein EXE42_03155 [Halorubrum sp. SP3]
MGRFHSDVEPHHLDIDIDEYENAYVVGDVHERLMRLASERVPDDRSDGDSEPRREPSVDLDGVFTSDTDAN